MKRIPFLLLLFATIFYIQHTLKVQEKHSLNLQTPIEETHEMVDSEGYVNVPATCFAPDTDPAVLEAFYRNRIAVQNSLGLSGGNETPEFNLGDRWSTTATDGGGLGQGDVTTLTWSYVPDGTAIGNGGCGRPDQGTFLSDFIAFFNGIYGPPTTPGDFTTAPWHNVFVDMFDSWSDASGLNFVYEPNDDGVTVVTGGDGVLGVRGDMRISGHRVDGNSNVLACNYFPNNGDMIIDTADNFFSNNPGVGTINVLTHEIGHGLGIQHVCPINQTKLMEPFVTVAFQGPQEDDILAVNRHYGDLDGENDSSVTATLLGVNALPTSYSKVQRSIDDNSDTDYFSFTVSESATLSGELTPTGTTYLTGAQNSNGSCSAGFSFNALTVSDLMFEILGTDGVTVLATGDANGFGVVENVAGVNLPAAGTYFVKVSQQGASINNVQMYDLDLDLVASGADAHPSAVCVNFTAQLDTSGNVTIVPANVDGGSSDPEGPVTLSVSPNTFTCTDIGDNTVTLTVMDNIGQTNTCTATVTIEDSILPDAICQDVTVQLNASGNATITASDINNGSTDNCGIDSFAVSPSTFTCANVGTNTVTLTVTDVDGNIATCTSTVTVEDNILPNAICQNFTAQIDASCMVTITAADIDNGSNDICGIDSLAISPSSFTCDDLGPNTVTLTVTDVNGNISTCTSIVTVESILGVGDTTTGLSTVDIFPNPANGVVNISNPRSIALEEVIIYDMVGRIVATHNLKSTVTDAVINISMLQSANYTLIIKGAKDQVTKRLTKK